MLEIIPRSRVDEDVCVMIRPANHKLAYLFDCGMASAMTIKEARDIDAIFVTHMHVDHFIGFEQIMRHQLAIGRSVTVCGPPGIAQQLSNKMNGFTWNLGWDDQAVTYTAHEVVEEGVYDTYTLAMPDWAPRHTGRVTSDTIFSDGQVAVRFGILDHNTPCIAYRMEEPAKVKIGDFPYRPGPWIRTLKEAFAQQDADVMIDVHGESIRAGALFAYLEVIPGDSVGFVMDHAATDENHARIAALMRAVQTLLIECYYREVDRELADQNAHSTARRSGEAARRASAQCAMPMHFSRRYNAEVDALRGEFFDAFQGPPSPVEPLPPLL